MTHPISAPLKWVALAACVGLLAATARSASSKPSALRQAEGSVIREVWRIPLPGQRLQMVTTVLRPPGKGPFPLAVINHGSTENSYIRAHFPLPLYPLVSQWLLKRGYVVALPLRPGHGVTGGPYFEDPGRCDDPHYLKSGRATAYSIQAAISAITAKPYVRKTGVLVLGESAGAWGALALASSDPTSVGAVINFSGGRGGHAGGQANHNCKPDRLVHAAGVFGRTTRIPTLWLYAKNDSYFAPSLSKRMFDAFTAAGGRAEYHLLPALGRDGHLLMESQAARVLWAPIVTKFLAEHP